MEPGYTNPNENAWSGLDYWMSRVLREYDRAREDFAPEPVHDLRVALRHCRSIANGFMVFDPHPAWKLMKAEGRQLFQQLGALRDTQVMMEWVQRIAPSSDETSTILNYFLAESGDSTQGKRFGSIAGFQSQEMGFVDTAALPSCAAHPGRQHGFSAPCAGTMV